MPEVVADECWSHVEVRLSILGCLACMTYIEKVGDDVIGKEQQGRLKTIQLFKGINFFFWGFHVLLLSEPFAIHETVMLGKLFMIFSHFLLYFKDS